jgi:hypothetical protein
MGKGRTLTRLALARHLQELALRIAAGEPVRVGGAEVRIPDRVLLEEEVETHDGVTELELELKWEAAKVAGRAIRPASPCILVVRRPAASRKARSAR